MNVQRGDRVRRAPNIAKHLMEKHAKDKRHKINWLTRRWVVIRVSVPTESARVKWDDRVTIYFWPIRALEKAI